MEESVLIAFLSASVLLTLSPGPDILYVFSLSLSAKKKDAIKLTWGLTTGLFLHTAVVALGWSEVLLRFPELVWSIKIIGASYLVYLAVSALRQKPTTEVSEPTKTKSYFWQGFLMNVTNPKVTLFFMVFFPGFVFIETLSLQTQFGVLGLLFWGQAFLIFNGVALLGDRIQKYSYFSLTQRFQNRLQAFVLLCIAVVLLMSA
ncbi:MAG: LysE family translocator [Flavobacteriales bacterium]|jgi:threonine/homoserine/homoserine lactone efflux protein|nr:LysE family translocator [Flavobacteriales bacterium]